MSEYNIGFTDNRTILRELLANMMRDAIVNNDTPHKRIFLPNGQNILVGAFNPPRPFRIHWSVRLNTVTGNPSIAYEHIDDAIDRIVAIATAALTA